MKLDTKSIIIVVAAIAIIFFAINTFFGDKEHESIPEDRIASGEK